MNAIQSIISNEYQAADKKETTGDASAEITFVWRETMDEGFIGARNYSRDVKENGQEQLKEWKTDFEKVVTKSINTFIDHESGQSYAVRSHAYHLSLGKYVNIKRFDESRKIYICRLKGDDKAGDIEAPIDSLSD
jgi:hypothetical protein